MEFVPFVAVGEDRVDVEDDAAEIEHAVAHHVTDGETRLRDWGRGRDAVHGEETIRVGHGCNLVRPDG